MHTRLIPTAAMIAAISLLAACSGPASGEAGDSGPLIVYTNSNADGRAEWLTEQAAQAGYEIQIVGQGGTDTTNKLVAEANNPVADVVFGLNHVYFTQLVDADLITAYTPSWAEQVDPELGDPSGEGNYWPLVQQGIVLAYDSEALDPQDAPQDWTDLWTDPALAGRYETVTELGGATTALVFAGLLSRYQDASGDLGVSDEGWSQIEQYFAEGNPAVTDVDLYQRMVDGDVVAGQMWTSGIPAREADYGVATGVAEPEVGVPFAVEQIAVVSGTSKQDTAEGFVDWFGSAETQSAWSAEFDSMPVNQDAIAQAEPSIVEFHESLLRQDLDWDFVTENLPAWIEKIELEYLP